MRGLLIALFLVGCADGAAPPGALRFVSLNTANGFKADDGTYPFRNDLARAVQRARIAGWAPDVLALQEVDNACPRSGGINTAAAIVPAGGTFLYAHGANDPGDGCDVGNALWLRPGLVVLREWKVQLDWVGNDWPRVAQFAHIQVEDGRQLLVAATHLSTNKDSREVQLPKIMAVVPDVLLGDFNAYGAEVGPMVKPLLQATSPGFETQDAIDEIWMQRQGRGWVEPVLGASDHDYAACGEIQ